MQLSKTHGDTGNQTPESGFGKTQSCTQSDFRQLPRQERAAKGARRSRGRANHHRVRTGGPAPGGHPVSAWALAAHGTSPCHTPLCPIQVVLPSGRQLPRTSATAGAASRAASSAQPTASMLPSAPGGSAAWTGGGGRGRGTGGGDGWGPESCSRPPWAPHSAPTASERSVRRGSARCRRDFPLARDAEQRAVLATAKRLRNRCRSSSFQPRLAVTKAGLDGATAQRSGLPKGVTSCSHATPEPSRRGTPTRAPPQLVTLSAQGK